MTNNLYAKIHFFRGALPKANGIRAVIVSVIRQSIHGKQEAEKNTKKRCRPPERHHSHKHPADYQPAVTMDCSIEPVRKRIFSAFLDNRQSFICRLFQIAAAPAPRIARPPVVPRIAHNSF